MLNDSIQLLDGSTIENLVVASGTAFPSSVQSGEMFFRTDNSSMYIWTGAAWQVVGSGASPAAGSEGSVQINTGAVFAGGADLVFTPASNTLTLGLVGETGIVSGLPSASGTKGGNITLSGGANSSTGQGGDVSIVGGNAASSTAGSIILDAGRRVDNAAGSGEIILRTWNSGSQVERFRILANGAWSVGSAGSNVGSAGQILTSNGNAAPTWQASAGATVAGSTTQIQYNDGAGLGADAGLTYTVGTSALTVGTTTVGGVIGGITTSHSSIIPVLTIKGHTNTYSGIGSNGITIDAGSGANGGGPILMIGGSPTRNSGGDVTVAGGNGGIDVGSGGALILRAGESNTAVNANGPNTTISGGLGKYAATWNYGGNVIINGGTTAFATANGGDIILKTSGIGSGNTLVERFRIRAGGAWSVGASGADYGTSGQVLTSNGNAAPTWQAASGGTPSVVASGATDGTYELGWKVIPQNSRSAAYTLVLADSGKHILHPSTDTTARTFTIPANSSVAYPIGTAVTFVNQNGGGVITIAITTDTMRLAGAGTTGSRTLAANGVATAIKITSTEWIISGTNLT